VRNGLVACCYCVISIFVGLLGCLVELVPESYPAAAAAAARLPKCANTVLLLCVGSAAC